MTRRQLSALLRSSTFVSLVIALLYVAALLATSRAIGYARDEGLYFGPADQYCDWLKILWRTPGLALTRDVVDAHFIANHEHPPLIKMLSGLSHELLYVRNPCCTYPGIAYRIPAMLTAALGVAVLVKWGWHTLSPMAGVVAGVSFALLPRVFHHAHLACFDVPVACLCLCTAYLWHRSLETGRIRWALSLGLVYGLTLATKHNAWLLAPALLLHGICVEGVAFFRGHWRDRGRLLLPAVCLLVMSPLVLFAIWPWLWFDTQERLADWVRFHWPHQYYNMEFLGRTYWKPPMPRAYASVMTLATVPLTTLVLFGLGSGGWALDMWKRLVGYPRPTRLSPNHSAALLWMLCLMAAYAPWFSPRTPIFGGTKHWLAAYPFLCLLAARGFGALVANWPERLSKPWWTPRVQAWTQRAAAALVVAPGTVTVWDMGPWGLSTYMPVVGGASGAATLGLNRTFWGYTAITLAPELTTRAPARVFIHDTATQSWKMHTQDGAWPESLRPTLSVIGSDVALYQHEPHMARIEYQIWSAYGTQSPVAVKTYEGVPVLWLYQRRDRPYPPVLRRNRGRMRPSGRAAGDRAPGTWSPRPK